MRDMVAGLPYTEKRLVATMSSPCGVGVQGWVTRQCQALKEQVQQPRF